MSNKNPNAIAIEMLKLTEGCTAEEVLQILAWLLYHIGYLLQDGRS